LFKVTREKTWKDLCPLVNPEMAVSSAAGYQLRKHYQRLLLEIECMEYGRNPTELIAFAEKQKKAKKKKPSEREQSESQFPPGNF